MHINNHRQRFCVNKINRRTFLTGMTCAGLVSALSPLSAHGMDLRKLDLSEFEARYGGRIGFCAKSGGAEVRWRHDERFAYCSTFKLFLAAATLERVQAGLDRLDRAAPIRPNDIVTRAPITKPAAGSSLTITELCKAAVEVSDNTAANILIREMGGIQTWQDWYRSIGDTVTRVDRYETELNSALPGDPRDTTSPEQYVANLDEVMLGGRLAPHHLTLLTL